MLQLKNIIATCCFVFLLTLSAQAQRDNERFKAIENEKIAYITKELKLSKTEAQQFFPIYNDYSQEMWRIRNQKTGPKQSSPSRGNGFRQGGTQDVLAYDAKELEIKKEYRAQFAKIIGNSRASQFFEIEQNFRELLYKEWQNRHK
ncbi:hypothetical protein [Sphingobacterium sp. SYP-B4668]|uniref:hypothetical protein n=1 Tax=Sphingobacterium sp. SYP-B4668 TaxID=2996035 RepID=UPI0022DD1B8E|nr:hypothetical protein [Sphingobacterium sp. SYP-B4668]